jgi:hypothetical protein
MVLGHVKLKDVNIFFIYDFKKMFFQNFKCKKSSINTSYYYLFLPFTVEQYQFWVSLFSLVFLSWFLYGEFRLWWIRELPKKDEDLLQRKGAFWALLYRVRTYSFKGLIDFYMEKLYEAFLILIMALMYFYHMRVVDFIQTYKADYRYREDLHKRIRQKIISMIDVLFLVLRVLKAILIRVWYFCVHVPLAYIYVYLSFLVEFLEVIAQKLIWYSYISFCLFPVYIYVVNICLVLVLTWFFLHKNFHFVLFSFLNLFGLSFPRLSIAVAAKKIKSVDDFYHENYKTLPLYVRLRTLVGSQIQNLWNTEHATKVLFSRKRLQFRRAVKGHDYEYARPFLKYANHPDIYKYPYFFNQMFFLKKTFRPSSVFYSRFNSQIVLPKILSYKLDPGTFLTKNILIKSRVKPVTGSIRPFKNDILESNPDSVVFNNSNFFRLNNNFNIPYNSFFSKNSFFQSAKPQISFLDAYNTYRRVADQRFIFRGRYRFPISELTRSYKPKSFARTNLNLLFNNVDIDINENKNCVHLLKKNIFSNIFLSENYIYDAKLLKGGDKRFLRLPLFKSRKMGGTFGSKLSFLILKKNLKVVRNRVFSAYPFFNSSPFWSPSLSFNRKSFLLKRIFLSLRNAYLGKPRVVSSRKFPESRIFLKFFYYFLEKQKKSYNLSRNLVTFLRQSYSYNYKLLVFEKLQSSFSSSSFKNFVPLSSLNNLPWWNVYSNLIETNKLSLYSDSFARELKKNKGYYSINLSGYAISLLLSRKISSSRFRAFNHHNLYFFLKKFFRRKKIGYKRKALVRRLLQRKSYEIRFFFDSKLYHNEYDLKRMVNFNNNLALDKSYVNLVDGNAKKKNGFFFLIFFLPIFLIFLFEPIVISLIFL